MRERLLLSLALLASGALAAYASAAPPEITPADAKEHAGREVVVSGYVRDVEDGDGRSRFVLAAAGWGLPVSYNGPAPDPGSFVALHGRITEFQGVLRLHAGRTVAAVPPEAVPADLPAIAEAPLKWTDRPLLLRGEVEDGTLAHRTWRLALDPPPPDGPADIRGVLAYRPSCLCHVLTVDEVTPWTP